MEVEFLTVEEVLALRAPSSSATVATAMTSQDADHPDFPAELVSPLGSVPGREVPPSTLGALKPVEVLVDIDGPRLFIALSPAGDELLTYHAEETDTELGWIVVPTDASTRAQLRAGEIPLRDALRQPWVWIVTQAVTGEVLRATRVSFGDIPKERLPAPGQTIVSFPCP